MSSQIRLSVVCRLSVTLLRPTQTVELLSKFMRHLTDYGLGQFVLKC